MGDYFVREMVPTMTQEQLEQLATCQPGEAGCSTEGWSLQTIRGGISALVIYAPESVTVATSVTWLEDGVQFTLMAPRSTLSDEGAIALANKV